MLRITKKDITTLLNEVQKKLGNDIDVSNFGTSMYTGLVEFYLVSKLPNGGKRKLQFLGIGNKEIYTNLQKILN